MMHTGWGVAHDDKIEKGGGRVGKGAVNERGA